MPVRTIDGRHTVEFQLRGLRVHRRCPPGTTKAEAQELENRLRREIFATRDLGREPTVSLPAAIERWLTERVAGSKSEKMRRAHSHALVDFVEGRTLRDIPAVAVAYRKYAQAEGYAIATVNARLNVLKAVAKWAWRAELIAENLSPRVPLQDPQNGRHRYESVATIRRIVSAAETREGRAWIALAAGTGLRAGELHRITPGQVQRGAVYLPPRTKNGEPRIVPVADWARPHLKALPFTRTRDSLDNEWRKARAAAGVEDFRFHDLRHSFASQLINREVPLEIVGKLLGNHPLTTRRYAHLYEATLRKAVKKVVG